MINNVMTTRYMTLLAGSSSVITKSVTTKLIFIKIKFEGDKLHLKARMLIRILHS